MGNWCSDLVSIKAHHEVFLMIFYAASELSTWFIRHAGLVMCITVVGSWTLDMLQVRYLAHGLVYCRIVVRLQACKNLASCWSMFQCMVITIGFCVAFGLCFMAL